MRPVDLVSLAFANLKRNRVRSAMTLVGVAIGVAALAALLAYGAGLQRTARGEFEALELYNMLRVTSQPNPLGAAGDVAFLPQEPFDLDSLPPPVALTDSLIEVLQGLDGVFAAYPEIVFPVRLKAGGGRAVVASAEAVPMAFGLLPAYRPQAGAFFSGPADSTLLLAPSMARRLGFDPPGSIVGDTLVVSTATLNVRALRRGNPGATFGMLAPPVVYRVYRLRVAGLLPEDGQALSGLFRIVVPLELAKGLRKITFFSTFDLLMRGASTGGYTAVRVHLADPEAYAAVRRALRERGLYVTGFRDQFARLERLFLVLDLALGIIGFIALLVATIGIGNTMMMNVLERTAEIGVMKAVGGDEGDLQRLFLIESATIGLLGGVAGLGAGWGITALLGAFVDRYLHGLGLSGIDVFYLPPWMAGGILALAVVISLAAGFVPARQAARVEPIRALRSVT
jgi:putative ABC transport system permease protein